MNLSQKMTIKRIIQILLVTSLLFGLAPIASARSEILDQCEALQNFEETLEENQKNECENNIIDDLSNNPAGEPSHALFNSLGPEKFIGTNSETDETGSASGCCYANNLHKDFDLNNNCQIDTNNGEECSINKRRLEIEQDCICAVEPFNAICSVRYVCQAGNSQPGRIGDGDEIIPFESEFFDVTSTEQGLRTDDQGKDFLARSDDTGPIFTIVNRAVNILVALVSTVALVIMTIGAYMLVTSQGNENQIEKGKNAIVFSLVGIAFVLLSFTIVRLVQSIFF